MEGFIDQAIAGIERCKVTFIDYFENKINELKKHRISLSKNIAAALEEVGLSLADEQPLLLTKYGSLFRKCTENAGVFPGPSFNLSISSINAINGELGVLTGREIISVRCDFDQDLPARLTGVFNDCAFLYDVAEQQLSRHTLSVNFNNGGSYVELDTNTVVCVGANPPSSAVYLLELSSFQLRSLAPLSTPRQSPGVAKTENNLYAFGGWNGNAMLKTCEKMEFSSHLWTDLRESMAYPRSNFTPCLFRSLFYLVSANFDLRTIETFDLNTETFAVLPVSLPSELILAKASVAFIYNGELCLLTEGKQMARWEINSAREFRLSNTGEIIWSNQQPLIVGSTAYIACLGDVKRFNLKSFSVVST